MSALRISLLSLLVLFGAGCQIAGAGHAAKAYPLSDCIVTGNELGSMGDPVALVYQGQEVKFCCAPCVEEFEEDPEFFMKQLGG
ncbi:MAG: hypothetical protein MK213_06970 [Planctomycetes bacterium]|nr:hypothetical protein [Planctomycetota bacterium]